MLIAFMNYFTKFTGWLPEQMILRPKVLFENKKVQRRRIRGAAIIISDHHSVYDYLAYMFVFFWRTLRFQMAEVLFKKKGLGRFLRALGGIYVDRDSHDFTCLTKSEAILRRGGVVGVFPEGRIPTEEEARPLPFKSGAAYLAYATGVQVIPAVTNGCYFTKHRTVVLVGTPIDPKEYIDDSLSEKENVRRLTAVFEEKIRSLEKQLNECDQ